MSLIHVTLSAMKAPLPPLGALRSFEAAARLLSFQRAAEELGVTQSAVSHQIAALEHYLNVKLFERLPRRVVLTDAGILYAPYASAAFERIASGTALLRRIGNTDDLVIEAYATFVVRWFIPRLDAIRQARPGLQLRFGTSQLDWELNIDSADVGVIYSHRTDRPNVYYRRLVQAQLVPVCTSRIRDLLGATPTPGALRRHTRLVLYTAPDDWRLWLEAVGLHDWADQAAVKFDSYLTAIEAAVDGQGIAIAPEFLVADDLQAGRLVRPFELSVAQPGAWYLICRADRRHESRISWFEEWIVAQFAATHRQGRS